MRTVCEPIFNKPLAEISFAQVLMRLFETARRFEMQVQPQLILLQKTLLQIEGLGRQLYPELDLWKTAQPILRDWAAERLSGRALASELRRQLPDLSEAIRSLPQLLQTIVQQASEGTLAAPGRAVRRRRAARGIAAERPPSRRNDRGSGRAARRSRLARRSMRRPGSLRCDRRGSRGAVFARR